MLNIEKDSELSFRKDSESKKSEPCLVLKLTGKEKFLSFRKKNAAKLLKLTGQRNKLVTEMKQLAVKGVFVENQLQGLKEEFWQTVYAEIEDSEKYQDKLMTFEYEDKELLIFPDKPKQHEHDHKHHGHKSGTITADVSEMLKDVARLPLKTLEHILPIVQKHLAKEFPAEMPDEIKDDILKLVAKQILNQLTGRD